MPIDEIKLECHKTFVSLSTYICMTLDCMPLDCIPLDCMPLDCMPLEFYECFAY